MRGAGFGNYPSEREMTTLGESPYVRGLNMLVLLAFF